MTKKTYQAPTARVVRLTTNPLLNGVSATLNGYDKKDAQTWGSSESRGRDFDDVDD